MIWCFQQSRWLDCRDGVDGMLLKSNNRMTQCSNVWVLIPNAQNRPLSFWKWTMQRQPSHLAWSAAWQSWQVVAPQLLSCFCMVSLATRTAQFSKHPFWQSTRLMFLDIRNSSKTWKVPALTEDSPTMLAFYILPSRWWFFLSFPSLFLYTCPVHGCGFGCYFRLCSVHLCLPPGPPLRA